MPNSTSSASTATPGDPNSKIDWHKTPLFLSPYRDEIETAAREFGVDPGPGPRRHPRRIRIQSESPLAQGRPGPDATDARHRRELGVTDTLTVADNIRGGVRYLARMLKTFDGDIRLATAAYNAGPGAVSRYKGVPPYAETRAYVERVGILHQRYAAH